MNPSDIESIVPSQYFVKFETLPIPNNKTRIEILSRAKFALPLFIVLLILNFVVLFIKSTTKGPNDAQIWSILNLIFCTFYVSNVSSCGQNIKKYIEDFIIQTQLSDMSDQFIIISKVWFSYAMTYFCDYMLSFWSLYGLLILIDTTENFRNSRPLQIFIAILASVEFCYFYFVSRHF